MLPDVLSSGDCAFVDVLLGYAFAHHLIQHSRAIENYSAMRAIVSALMSLKLLRRETSFSAPDLEKMARFSCAGSIRKSKTAGRPYLCPLRMLPLLCPPQKSLILLIADIFASYPVDFLDIVGDQRIRWSTFKELYHKVDMHVSQKDFPLISPQPYSFHRGSLVERAKNILVNVELIDAKSHDESAAKRYRDANRTRPMFSH
jgi:hypothetical protein